MADFIHACASCDARRCCEYTFGRFYREKSSDGVGCNYKITPFDIDAIMRRKQQNQAVVPHGTSSTINSASTARLSRADILERLKRMRRS